MNDTQSTPEPVGWADRASQTGDPIAELAEIDPALAPDLAERHAADLEAELEGSDVFPRPQQMQTDFGEHS